LLARKEERRLLRANDYRQADQEEDLLGARRSESGEVSQVVRRRRRRKAGGEGEGGVCTLPIASMARSKKRRTPPMRKKPPVILFVSPGFASFPILVFVSSSRREGLYAPPEQNATPISVKLHISYDPSLNWAPNGL
jgi:hypothetical protein